MMRASVLDMVAQIGGDKLIVGEPFFKDPSAIMMRENDSRWRDWINWALQRMWSEGTLEQLYVKNYKMKPTFDIWQNGMLQPGVLTIGKERDPWKQ